MKFRIGRHPDHNRRPIEVIEVFDDDDNFLAAILPAMGGTHLRIVSEYIPDADAVSVETAPPSAEAIAAAAKTIGVTSADILRQKAECPMPWPISVTIEFDLSIGKQQKIHHA